MASTCGERVVRLLEEHGVDTVFGISGVHTLEIYRGLCSSPIRQITPRHEQGVGFMADGYARRTGKPGVAIVISGPGVTNIATPVASAYHDSIPLLVISSVVSRDKLGRGTGTIHDLPDQHALMESITGGSWTVRSPEELAPVFARAFAMLSGRRPRPVHVQIPTDVLAMEAPSGSVVDGSVSSADGPLLEHARPSALDPVAIAESVRLLESAKRPFIIAGGGARDCGAQICELADRTDALIGYTIGGKSVVPSDHPRCVGATMTFEPVSAELCGADVVLAIGTEFSELDYWAMPTDWSLRGQLIRLDIDGAQMRGTGTPAVSVVSDARCALRALLAGLPSRGKGSGRRAPRRNELTLDPSLTPYLPLLDALDGALPRDRVFSGDSTQPAYAANHLFPVYQPRSWLMPIGYGALGCAVPMAIGAKVADPAAPVLALVGDAGLLFSVAELATAADLRLGMPVVVWNNDGYGEIRDAMDQAGIPHIGTDARIGDIALLASGLGCRGERASSSAELQRLVGTALDADVPTVIEVRADEFVVRS